MAYMSLKSEEESWAGYLTPVIPALRRLRQEAIIPRPAYTA